MADIDSRYQQLELWIPAIRIVDMNKF